jgi:hypothetical protein
VSLDGEAFARREYAEILWDQAAQLALRLSRIHGDKRIEQILRRADTRAARRWTAQFHVQ